MHGTPPGSAAGWPDERLAGTRLAVATSGALSTADGANVVNPAHAPSGASSAPPVEHPDRIMLLDLDEPAPAVLAAALATALATGEPQLAVRDGAAYAPRLVRLPAGGDTAGAFDPDGTVLITGASGVLGGLVARHLATVTARAGCCWSAAAARLPGAGDLRSALAGLGAEATFAACDVADRDALAATLPRCRPRTR